MRFNKEKDSNSNRFADNSADFNFSAGSKIKKREVPFGIILTIFFSDVSSIIGVAFTAIGTLFLIVFGSFFFDSDSIKIAKDDPFASAVIQEITPTNTTINDELVYKYTYTFQTPDGEKHSGSDNHFLNGDSQGDTIIIQYAYANPNISMLTADDDSMIPWWIILLISIFPIIGILMIGFGIRKLKRSINILNYGETAWGTYKGQEPTGSSVNEEIVYRLFFTFTAHDGKEYTAQGETHKTYRLRDEEQELVIYNTSDPSQAFPVDAYPSSVKKFISDN